MVKLITVIYIRGLLVISFMSLTDGAGSTGNSLVTCAACEAAQVKFGSWDCNINCDVISSDTDITVTSTLIRELMNKVDQLNKTVAELQKNNTALAEKVKVMEEANCAFSVRLAADVNTDQKPVKFETVDLNICDGYSPATGIFTPTLDGTYYLALSVQARDDNTEMMIMRNNDFVRLGFQTVRQTLPPAVPRLWCPREIPSGSPGALHSQAVSQGATRVSPDS